MGEWLCKIIYVGDFLSEKNWALSQIHPKPVTNTNRLHHSSLTSIYHDCRLYNVEYLPRIAMAYEK